jgi:hypothetical protein
MESDSKSVKSTNLYPQVFFIHKWTQMMAQMKSALPGADPDAASTPTQ